MTQALLETQKNRHTKCSQGRDHNLDYRQAHGKEWSGDGSVALYSTRWYQLQESALYSVSCWSRREVKEDAVHHHGWRESNGRAWIFCFLVQVKSGAVTSTWVESSAPMVGMVAQEGISAGSLEVGMDEVGKAHGTSVCPLLEEDGRAPWPDADGDAHAHADVDADGKTSFLGCKESEIQTDSIVHNKVLFFH